MTTHPQDKHNLSAPKWRLRYLRRKDVTLDVVNDYNPSFGSEERVSGGNTPGMLHPMHTGFTCCNQRQTLTFSDEEGLKNPNKSV